MKKILILLFAFIISNNSFGQQVPNVKNSWLGNSNPFNSNFVPQGIEGMCVDKDGVVYTNVPWEEGGGNFTEIKTNGDVSHGEASFGWGLGGGSDVASNSTYVYWSMSIGNENGGLVWSERWPTGNNEWLGVSRRLKSDVKQGAPFTGGKGWPLGSVLVALEYDRTVDQPWIQGLYATETELFVSIYLRNLVKVFDAQTMEFKREFSVPNPHQINMDSFGNLWIAEGFDAVKIKRYTPSGTLMPEAINLPAGSLVGDFCIDKNDNLYIGDVGQREQVLIYNNINFSPTFSSTFGDLNGIHSGISGRNAPLKFQQIRGIGTDDAGNIYIGNTQWHTGGQGTMVEKYNLATGVMDWKRHCTMFVDAMGIDEATDGGDVYGKVEHFKIDYTKPEGEDGYYSAYTIDRYKYPHDPRLWQQFASVLVKNIKGQKFLAMSSMNGGLSAIFRFSPTTDGDIAIPCIVFGGNVNPRYPGSINNGWMWRDLNANGQMEVGEYTQTGSIFIDGGHGAHMDDNGDIWQSASEYILHNKCLGLDANNIPLYTGKYELIAAPTPAPSPDVKVKRVYYDVKLDRMYTAGATITQPTIDSWQSMGRAINRYDNWSTGNRTASLPELVLPAVTVNGFTVPISFKVVDEYIFVGFLGGDNTIPRLQLNIYKVSDHSFVGYIRAPWEGVGLFDVIQSIDGYKRKNGEYVIVVEEDGRNKNVMYRWTPAGPLIETTDILTANTNYVKFTPAAASQALTIASNIAWTVTGEPTWLTATPSGSGNGTATLTATANTGNTSRSAIITLAGGAVSNQITIFQEFSDADLPTNATALTATKITPFDFNLNWIESTDNVMVSGYEIFKNGVLYKTISGTNINFTGLMPNSPYTIMVKAYDEAGNKSTGTTLIVNTLDVTYPYITARGHANFETPQRAFDGINWSTWMDWDGKTWLQIQYAAPVVYNQYSIYNQDNPNRERDPENWVVKGSNDGIIFTDLSTQSNQNWAEPATSKNFYFINSTAYRYYKLDFENGNGLVLGEVIFNNGPIIDTQSPTVPIALTASGITQNSADLNWDASTDNVGVYAYEVFQNGVLIATVPAANSYTALGLAAGATYSFNVRANDGANNFSEQSSPLLLQTGQATLSVNLSSFVGKLTNNGNQLNWVTASEKNNSRFELERSGDGKTFETIATLKGAGTINTQQFYNYLDNASPFKTSYYRLKQIDNEGRFIYSESIAIKLNFDGRLSIYPNPFSSEINVSIEETFKPTTKIFLYDMFGRNQPIDFTLHGGTLNCKTNNLPIGSYVLRVVTEGAVYNKMIVKIKE